MADGRATKFNKATQSKILRALRTGATMVAAAAKGGINKSTLYDWLEKGRLEKEAAAARGVEPAGAFAEFADAVMRARAESEVLHLENIAVAGRKDWRAAAWILEKRFPQAYGNKVAVLKSLDQMSDDELDQFIATGLAEAAVGGAGGAGAAAPETAPGGSGGAGE